MFTYDGSIFEYDWDPVEAPLNDMLVNSGQVKAIYTAIHIDKSTKTPVYESSSGRVAENYDYEEMIDWTPFYDKALRAGMKLIVYAGEYD